MGTEVTMEFLQSKSFSRISGWNGKSLDTVRASSGNITVLTEHIFGFREYNFLPIEGSELAGHYDFYVNIKTFEYVVVQNGYYGSLTYTTPAKDKSILKLNEIDTKIVEAKIAHKLLGAYYHEPKTHFFGTNLFKENRQQGSIICDDRGCDILGRLSDKDKDEEALKILDK